MKKTNKKHKIIILTAIALIIVIIGILIGTNAIKVNILTGKYNSSNGSSSNGNLLPEYIKSGITLAGVTGTLEDLDTSDATATADDILWGKTAYVDGKKITGTYRTLGMLQVGDYVAYTPDSETASSYPLAAAESGYTSDQTISKVDNLGWRVLSINDDGTVDLISSSVASNDYFYFKGALGYNNGVYLLNHIADELYSNDSLGVTARSLTIEDIEKGMTEDGIGDVHSPDGGWGQTKTYTSSSHRYYPNLYAQENGSGINTTTTKTDGIGQSDSYYTSPTTETYSQASTDGLTVTQTFYYTSISSSCYKNSTFYNLIHGVSGNQWLASRYVIAYSTYADFGLRYVSSSSLISSYLFGSYSGESSLNGYLRPVVSLKSNIRLSSGDGSSSSPYQIAD